MTKNKSLDEIQKNIWGRGYNAGYWNAPRKAKDRIYPEQDDVKQAKEEIHQSLLSLIGEDEPEYSLDNPNWGKNRIQNELRAELRTAIKEWIGE